MSLTSRRRLSRRDVIEALRQREALGTAKHRLIAREDRELYDAIQDHFASFHEARMAAGLRASRGHHRRQSSLPLLLEELRRLHAARVRLTTQGLVKAGRMDLLGQIDRFVGSIVVARRLAGLPEPPPVIRARRTSWDVERVVDEILRRHERGESLAHSKVPVTLLEAGRKLCGSWAAAIEAAGLDYADIRLHREPWSRDDVCSRLRELSTNHPEWTRADLLEQDDVCSAADRLFGSLDAALVAAQVGLPRRNKGWSRRDVVSMLEKRHRSGADVSSRAVRDADPPLYTAAVRHFGTFDKALRAVGLPGRARTRRWTTETIIAELRRASRADQHPGDVPGLTEACGRIFGSVYAAMNAADVVRPIEKAGRPRSWTPERVIAQLQELSAEGPVSGHQVGSGLREAASRLFGSFQAAKRAAGLPVTRRTWTREAVILELQVATRSGKRASDDRNLIAACRNYFGSMAAAREAAGLPIRVPWTPDRIVAVLREAASKLGRSPTTKDVRPGMIVACAKLFGGFNAAKTAAGLPSSRDRRGS